MTKEKIIKNIKENIKTIFNLNIKDIELDIPPQEKMGDYAFSCFNLAQQLKKEPKNLAEELKKKYQTSKLIKKVNNIGPYLNLFINPQEFNKLSLEEIRKNKYKKFSKEKKKKIMIEFSSPNTNKPQHLGHLRNNVLGESLSNILEAQNNKVIKANLINDRGIHIIKSMLAWQKWGHNETPENTKIKGDHFVGQYYLKFAKELKKEKDKYFQNINLRKLNNLARKELEANFLKESPLMREAQKMLQAWENNDQKIKKLWQKMNSWVYTGFQETYQELNISFDKIYYESKTYKLGKDLIKLGLKKKVFYQKKDNSIWIDLTSEGLDKKLVLRKDGTSVYITQDLGTAVLRQKKYTLDQIIYVVASEQDYHFKVLFLILKKLGFKWASTLFHLSYGLVNLPEGRMKSREGQVVEGDDIIEEMKKKAQEIISQSTKQIITTEKEKKEIINTVGLGALKFFLLSTNPNKDITFNPQESISFDGYTGPFIQYTHARIFNILQKEKKIKKISKLDFNINFNEEENKLIKELLNFTPLVKKTADDYNPALLTKYLFSLAKTYNNFYQHHSVLKAENNNLKQIRLNLCLETKRVLQKGLELLGIESPPIM